MKRKRWKSIAVITIVVVVAAFSFNFAPKGNNLPDIALQNIEALAFSELTPNGWSCFKEVRDDTSSDIFGVVVDCTNCYTTSATFAQDLNYCWHY